MSEFLMPSLGADMDAATLVEWRVKPGDAVKRGDVVAAVETAKGIIDIEIYEAGTIEAIKVPVGERVPVGTVLAILRGEAGAGAPAPATPASAPAVTAPPAPPSPAAGEHVPASQAGAAARTRVSPAARKRAAELHVAVEGLAGTGADGAVTIQDVERAAGPRPDGMRATIAAAMERSKREIPHYYLETTVDLKPALDWLAQRNQSRPVTERLLYGVLLLRAVALALRGHPDFNGHWISGSFRRSDAIHVGMAVALRQGGLVAPALHDTDRTGVDELMRALLDVAGRARGGHLRASELADATITVTSLGERGVDAVFPVIYAPQVAIVGFGTPATRSVVTSSGAIEPRPCLTATLAADHRVTDGHRGALFLAAIRDLLQEPDRL